MMILGYIALVIVGTCMTALVIRLTVFLLFNMGDACLTTPTSPPPPTPPPLLMPTFGALSRPALRGATTQLMQDLVDPDDCQLDHHGYCQAHGWSDDDRSCPHARAKALLELEGIL